MKLTKQRLETFSDGVIAIIITIMMLSIPLPESFEFDKMMGFLGVIFIYFISFIVVGSFWSRHHKMFIYIDEIDSKIVWLNLLYLFFLSLLPIFTKLVMQNSDKLVPAIAYDIIFLLVTLSNILIFKIVLHTSKHEVIVNIRNSHGEFEQGRAPKISTKRFVITIGFVIAAIVLSISIPRVSTVFLLGLPVLSAIADLIFDDFKHENNTDVTKHIKSQPLK